MLKNEQLLEKRLMELSKTAYHRDIITYSDFLNLNELNILHSLPKDKLYTSYVTFGGYDLAERQMAAFLPDALSFSGSDAVNMESLGFPFSAVNIEPLHEKYSQELTHRDYLGAILNLGIDRSKLGDILVEGKNAVLFIYSGLEDFLLDELTRVKHTSVTLHKVSLSDYQYSPRIEEIKGTVASVRLDSLLSLAFVSSRTKLGGLIEGAKVFVNGKIMTTNSYQVKEEDVISVRGMGKFKYKGTLSRTKKNRIFVVLHKYV
ncbi:MAG: YlmH/Sll1252 family protein [Muricomes sp.]